MCHESGDGQKQCLKKTHLKHNSFSSRTSPRSVQTSRDRPSTGHASRALECRRGGDAEEQQQPTGLRTDGYPPHEPRRARRVIKRLDGPTPSCSQVQTRRTHAHRPICTTSTGHLRVVGQDTCYTTHT